MSRRRGGSCGRPRSCAPDGDHLLHRHPRQRGAVYHRRSGEKRQDRNCAQRENPYHSAAVKALPQAAQVCRAAKNRLRRNLSHQKRQSNVKISNLVKDEEAVRPRGRRRRESFPTQSAPPVRDGILSRIQGHRQAGGCSWAFEHRNDANLPCHKCGRASASARTAKTCIIKTESIFCCAKMLKRTQLSLYSQLKRMQRSSCLRQRTLKWVQRHKLTVRFPL